MLDLHQIIQFNKLKAYFDLNLTFSCRFLKYVWPCHFTTLCLKGLRTSGKLLVNKRLKSVANAILSLLK